MMTMLRASDAGLIAIVVTAILLNCAQQAGESTPRVYPASSLKDKITSIPSYTRFAYSGVGSLEGKFFATTNLGVLEISDGQVNSLSQWNSKDPVIEGPWENKADSCLVVQDASSGRFIALKSGKWSWLPLPRLPSGEFSRRDALQGFRGYSNQKAFWMVGGKHAWRWSSDLSQWALEALPPSREGVFALIPFDECLLTVSREDPDTLGDSGAVIGEDDFKSDKIHRFSSGSWSEVKNEGPKFIAKKVVSAAAEGFILIRLGAILRVSEDRISKVESPGTCETLSMTSAGRLIASFRGKGI